MSKEEQELQKAFSEKEKAEKLISNLENLNAQGSLSAGQYTQIKTGYDKTLSDATTAIDQIKSRLTQKIASENTNIELFSHELQSLEVRFKIGELKGDEFQKDQQKLNEKIHKSENIISELQKLVNAKSSLDVGGYLEKSKGLSIGTGSFLAGGKKTALVLIGIIAIIAIIGGFLLISGGPQPQDAVVQYLQHINNGEYSQALSMMVDPTTMQPYSETEQEGSAALMKAMLGAINFRISNITILSSQRINNDEYLITASATSSSSLLGLTNQQTTSGTVTVVKINGQWKLAENIEAMPIIYPSGSAASLPSRSAQSSSPIAPVRPTPVASVSSPSLTLYSPTVNDNSVSINGATSPGANRLTIVRIHWDWGDGTSQDSWFPATHTYSNNGVYSIQGTSYQSDGQTTTQMTQVTISSYVSILESSTMTTLTTFSGSNSLTTNNFYAPSYWELWYTADPKVMGGQGQTSATGSNSAVFPTLSIQVMDGDNPNQVIRTIEPPGGLDITLWRKSEIDPRPWVEKFYEGNKHYYLIVNAQFLNSYAIEIRVPKTS